MEYNYSRLRGKIVEKYGKISDFCQDIGMSKTIFSLKLNNKSDFSREQMETICNKLDIKLKDIPIYFFTKTV